MCDKTNYLKCCVTVLILLEIMLGIMLLCITAYFHQNLTVFLPKTERPLLLSHISNIYLQSFENLVCYSMGLVMWYNISKNDTIKKHSSLLILWNSFCSIIIVFGSLTILLQYNSIDSLQITFQESLFQGIDLYFSDPEWKLLWDEIQFRNECCGVIGFKDWQNAAWNPQQTDDCQQMSKDVLMIPYTCCKKLSSNCFGSFVSHETHINNLYTRNITTINSNGCFSKFQGLTQQFSIILCRIWISCLLIQVLILVFIIYLILRSRRITFDVCSKESDEQPLVVVKYSRNIRCITLTDEETFDDEPEKDINGLFPKGLTEGALIRQDIFENFDTGQNMFVH